jgi:ethanolaminephosphotransferase
MLMLATGVITVLGNVYQVFMATQRNVTREHGAKFGVSWLCRNYPFLHALTRAFPLLGISILANLWFVFSPTHVYRAHPRIFCWTAGLLFTKLSIHLMIAHLCSMEFHPFRRTLVPFFAIGAHWFLSAVVGAKSLRLDGQLLYLGDEELLLLEFFALSMVTFGHLTVNAILETAEALNINVFVIRKPKSS